MVLATTSCGGPKKEEMKIKVIDSSVTLPNYYKDRDGIEWSRDNIFAPRENESLFFESPFQYAPATLRILNASLGKSLDDSTCGPRHKSTKSRKV